MYEKDGRHEFLKKYRLLVGGRRLDLDHLPTYDRFGEKNRGWRAWRKMVIAADFRQSQEYR